MLTLWFTALASAAAPPDPVQSLPVPFPKSEGPHFPFAAGTAATGQRCLVDASVDAEGHGSSVTAFRCDPLLADAAASAIARWQWKPAVIAGEPLALHVHVGVTFLEDRGDVPNRGQGSLPPDWTLEASDEPGCTLHLYIAPDYRVVRRATNDLDRCEPHLALRLWDPGLGFPDSTRCERDFTVTGHGALRPPYRFDDCGPAADVVVHDVLDGWSWHDATAGPVRLIVSFDGTLPRSGAEEAYPLVGAWVAEGAIATWTAVDDDVYGVTFTQRPDGTSAFRIDIIERAEGALELLTANGMSFPTRLLLAESDARSVTFRTPPDQLPSIGLRYAREIGRAPHTLEVTEATGQPGGRPVQWEVAARARSASLDAAIADLVQAASTGGVATWLDAFEPTGRVWAGDQWNLAPKEAATGVFADLAKGKLSMSVVANGFANGSALGFATGTWRVQQDDEWEGGTWVAILRAQPEGGWRIARLVWR